jgi:hypothetical protein
MTALVLIPGLISFWVLWHYSTRDALLNVYLPSLLLFPVYFVWRIGGVPPISASAAAALPFLLFLILRHRQVYFFSRCDIWIFFYVYGGIISEMRHTTVGNGLFAGFLDITDVIIPYLMGKLLIEQYFQRTPTLRRINVLLCCVAVLSIFEFITATNPYHRFLGNLFPGQGLEWVVQTRYGFGRTAGPFSHAISAGMMFQIGLVNNFWLLRTKKWEHYFKKFPIAWISKPVIITATMILGILMTISRGPWLGALFGWASARVGMAKNIRRAFVIFILSIALIGGVVYPIFKKYIQGNGTFVNTQSEEQRDAVYRAQLATAYAPIIARNPFWGWGADDYPKAPMQASIDDEYLFILVTRGYFGLVLFIIIAGDSLIRLAIVGMNFPKEENRMFSYCLLGNIAGILLTIGTVYLGSQVVPMFFLIIGWSQAVGQRRLDPRPQFQQVYV